MTNNTGVKVVVRVRPLSSKENEGSTRTVVEAINDHILVFDPADDRCEINGMSTSKFVRGDITRRRNKNLTFAFDHVFGPESSNVEIYEHTSKVILDGLLNGYNCSVFAYGATGAGKTYTMLGTNDFPGITFLTLMDLYQRIEAIKTEKSCDVAVSYLEIYNEQIKDLLNSKSQLPIREDPKAGIIIPGLTLHKPQDEQDLLKMLYFGNQNRSQHPTDANAESSRSHAVFQVFVKQSDRTANLVKSVHIAKMCLVDLAGSERGTATSNRGPRMREGANINRSLLALGNVINALADEKTKGYIPYRDSKLTRLLKDSIGGNCRTVMIAAVSPSHLSYEDTYNTLKYADRAKHIRVNLKKNIMNVKSNISKYGKIVEGLREEVQQLKTKLKEYESVDLKASIPKLQECEEEKRLQEILYNLFTERKSIRKEILKQESDRRANRWKIHCKQHLLTQMEAEDQGETDEHLLKKTKKAIDLSNKRIKSIDTNIANLKEKFVENEKHLERLQGEMTLNGEKKITALLEEKLRSHHLEVELGDSLTYINHVKKIANFQEVENNSKDRLINSMQQTMTKLYKTVQQHQLLSSELQVDYNQTMRQRYGEKEVVWVDETILKEADKNPDSISLEGTLDLPTLSRVVLSPTLDKNIRQRRESLTPILKKTKCFLNSKCNTPMSQIDQTPKMQRREDYTSRNSTITSSTRKLNNSTVSAVDQSLKRPRSEESKSAPKTSERLVLVSNSDGLKSPSVENQISVVSSSMKENDPRKDTVSDDVTALNNTISEESEVENIIKDVSEPKKWCSIDTMKSLSATIIATTPNRSLASIASKTPSPLAQLLSPAIRPSTREASHLNLAGGATITKSKPTFPLKMLNINKPKGMIVSAMTASAKENIKDLHRYKTSSMFERSTVYAKKLQRSDSQKLKSLHKFPMRLGPQGIKESQITLSSSKKPTSSSSKFIGKQRSLFRSKSVSDLRN
ncbi:kinesin-like protein KIF18A isoform X2 [Octopus sinensis]|uniref:Kinesin-like protein n=1 Tax=Octopus sinensis TaxID=2607531 RepID=A0A6P7SJH0_9MOLL|nr:kinesin-like protein KIF18A isoform X2 [Octopus sinensis]